MKIFVTGGAGFICSHVVDGLLKKRFLINKWKSQLLYFEWLNNYS